MFTPESSSSAIDISSLPVDLVDLEHPSSLPGPERLFYPDIDLDGVGMTMLTDDKLIGCEGISNSTDIENSPGATIISPILLSIAGVAGHITALFYLHRTTKHNQQRTVFYLLLATLIWTDLFGKLITTPPAIVSYAYGTWTGGKNVCNLHGLSMTTIHMVTHFLVASMAIDRCLCVRHGYFYKGCVTRSRVRISLICVWAFSCMYCAMPLFGVGEYELQYPGTWCFINIHVGSHTPWDDLLHTNIFGALAFMNVIIIIVCNLVVIGTLITARISRERKFSASSRHFQKTISISAQRELEIQMSIVLFVITIVFIVSWLPLDFRIFLNQIWPHTCREEHMQDLIAVRLASFNQIVDPWAYIICRKVFTSKVWRHCRTVIIFRSLSSKRQRFSTVLNHKDNLGGSATLKIPPGGTLPIKRKLSLPTPDKCQIFSKDSCERVNEISTNRQTSYPNQQMSYPNQQMSYPDQQITPFFNQNSDLEKGIYSPLYENELPNKVYTDLLSTGKYLTVIHMENGCKGDQAVNCHSYTPLENIQTDSENDLSAKTNIIRRHSLDSHDPSIQKHLRSKSTQTFEDV